jgi:hypothetical protein
MTPEAEWSAFCITTLSGSSRARIPRLAEAPGHMQYVDGVVIQLGDVVSVPVPGGMARARVVMLGDTYEHLDIDSAFLRWVKSDRVLANTSVVVEWLGANPLAHINPKYAAVGNYMFTPADQYLVLEA